LTEAKLLIATTNPGKIKEIQIFLENLPVPIYSLSHLNIKEFFPEDGQTFLENARGKSLFYGRNWGEMILGEDSGLEIDYLDGAPGVLSARYSDPGATDDRNIRKVLDLMEGVPWEKRTARFVSCMVLSLKGKILKEIEEHAEGFIALRKIGENGFGYDPLFFYAPKNATFAQLPTEEKNLISHRGRALTKLNKYLENHLRE